MRFAELHLLKYGKFEGCDLHFPKQTVDFHIIFGANEAGKSTTLAAVGDLLFGFPHGKAQDYRFDASLLRVGAVLEQDTQRTAVRRKRGRGATLMDAQDSPVSEAVLAGMLHGQTRETFHAAWSLDHGLLRAGGEAILAAKNDIGQALFAAGSGLTGVTRILETLEEEGDSIWGARARASRSYTRLSRDLKDAKDRLRAAEVRPLAWKTAYDHLEDLERQQAALDGQQQALLAEQRSLERARRILEPAQQLHALQASLNGQTAPLFTPVLEALFDSSFTLHAEAVLQQGTAERLLAEEEERLRAIIPDEACLQHKDELELLIEQRSIGQAVEGSLPDKQAKLHEKTLELEEALRALRLQAMPAATLLLTLPAAATVTELKRLLDSHTALDSALHVLRNGYADAQVERDAAARALADHEVLPASADLQTVVEASRRMGDLDGQAEQARRLQAERIRQAADAFARLLPWVGDASALRQLTLPSEDLLQAARDRETSAVAVLADETRLAGRLREEVAGLQLDRELLLKAGTGVAAAVVSDARKAREACWGDLRAHMEGRINLASPRTEISRYEDLTAQADSRADERFLSAEASGRLAHVDTAVATAELHLSHAEVRIERANTAQMHTESLWSAELARRSLPVLSVARLREWMVLREEAVQASSLAETSAEALHATQTALDSARQHLADATGQLPGQKSFRQLLDAAEITLKAALDSTTTYDRLKADLRRAEDKVFAESRKVDRNLAETRDWQVTWNQAVAKAHLDSSMSAADLDNVALVRATAMTVQQLRDEIETASSTQKDFLARLGTLWTALEMPDQPQGFPERIDVLKRRLQTARDNQQRIATITTARNARDEERRTAEARRASAERSLQPLLQLAAVESLPALAERVEESRRVRKVLDEIDDVKGRILSLGDGLPLAALLKEVDGKVPDSMAMRSDELSHELDTLGKQIRDTADLAGVSRTNFQALDHGASASEAAADAEMANAELDVQAEAYLLKRTETLLLRWAVERKRKQTQNPLLQRAGQLFSILTGNRYSSLSLSDEGSASMLLGNPADESRPVPVDKMSEGTIDQLFLALRVASMEQSVKGGSILPVLADDLFINFDDRRAEAGFRILGELAKSTQVLFFTHHQHLLDIARKSMHPHETRVCNL
ncbi:MAG: AAA family ATPase [Janthinobacterium lividum]